MSRVNSKFIFRMNCSSEVKTDTAGVSGVVNARFLLLLFLLGEILVVLLAKMLIFLLNGKGFFLLA